MYHILAAEGHRQDGTIFRKNNAGSVTVTHPPGLVEALVAVFPGIGRVDQHMHLARSCRILDALRAGHEGAATSLEAEAIKRLLAEGSHNAVAKICRNGHVLGLECVSKRTLELALGIGCIELFLADAYIGTAPGSAGTHIGRDLTVGRQREPD